MSQELERLTDALSSLQNDGADPEAMTWCERNRVAYVFGLAGNQVLLRRVVDLAELVG